MHPALIDLHNNAKTVLGEKHFTLINYVFELATGLRPSEIGKKNEDLVALVKNEAKLSCSDKVWSSFSCVSAFSSVIFNQYICSIVSVGLLSMRKYLISYFILEKSQIQTVSK